MQLRTHNRKSNIMFTWARLISIFTGVVSFFNELLEYIEREKTLAQGRALEQARLRELEDERISQAARARDDVIVTDGMQSEDVSRLPDKDPFNRDNWKR